MRIGYEFEVLSLLDDDEIERDLKKIFKTKAKKFEVTTDCTIKRDKTFRVDDGWQGWEIITPPEEESQALETLDKLQSYFQDGRFETNSSCGFHVNISARNMKKFDPLTLIATVDEFKFAKLFARENNPYCVPWFYYFDQIWKRVKRDTKVTDKTNTLIQNAWSLVGSAARGEIIDDTLMETVYAYRVSKFFDEKCATINVSKLNLKDPYIEFRMMGGKDYHVKMLSPMVKELSGFVNHAAKGTDQKTVVKYFEQW